MKLTNPGSASETISIVYAVPVLLFAAVGVYTKVPVLGIPASDQVAMLASCDFTTKQEEEEENGNWIGLERGYEQTRAMPGFRFALGPSRRYRLMVPSVVGAQLRVVGTPTLMERPPVGMLKGLGADCAVARAARAEVTKAMLKRILMILG